ncbi:MAG: sensor histidine kinase [bacterium]
MTHEERQEIQWGIWPSKRSFILSIAVIGILVSFFNLWFEMLIARPPDFFATFYRNFPLEMTEAFLKLFPLLVPLYLYLNRIRQWPTWKRFFFFVGLATGTTIFEELAAYYIPAFNFDRFDTEAPSFLVLLSFDMAGDILIFLTVLSAIGYMDHSLCRNQILFARLSEERTKLAEEEKLRLIAELKALQAQINPHFLFNTLNSLTTLVVTNAHEAENLIRDLSDWYRDVLGASRQARWDIGDEIELIRNYLKIESVRLGKRLSYDIECDDGLKAIVIPPLILQPLVENAVKHGIETFLSGGKIHVEIKGQADRFDILIEDTRFDGDLVMEKQASVGTGSGIENVKKRLTIAFEGEAHFDLHFKENGAVVSIAVTRGQNK